MGVVSAGGWEVTRGRGGGGGRQAKTRTVPLGCGPCEFLEPRCPAEGGLEEQQRVGQEGCELRRART